MGVTLTSRKSYKKTLPHLGFKQDVIFQAIKYANCRISDRDLSKFLGWPINQVTPRRGELVGLGVVEEAGLVYDFETNRHCQTWRLARGF